MNNKSWVEELIEEFENWEDLVKHIIVTRLDDYVGTNVYMCELDCYLLESENANGSFTHSTHYSIELIKAYFDDFSELVEEYHFSTDTLLNPFESPEGFIVTMLFEQARNILSQVSIIDELWNEERELTQEIIDKIKEELN